MKPRLFAAVTAFLALALDFWLKHIALLSFPEEGSFVPSAFFALILHKNPGIAFDLPIPLPLVIAVSILIIGILVWVTKKNLKTSPNISLFASFIILGAIGNLVDRIIHGFTTDYLLLFGRSVINISDILILTGVVGLLISEKYAKSCTQKIDSDHLS